jgi:hypothetical protein
MNDTELSKKFVHPCGLILGRKWHLVEPLGCLGKELLTVQRISL